MGIVLVIILLVNDLKYFFVFGEKVWYSVLRNSGMSIIFFGIFLIECFICIFIICWYIFKG